MEEEFPGVKPLIKYLDVSQSIDYLSVYGASKLFGLVCENKNEADDITDFCRYYFKKVKS